MFGSAKVVCKVRQLYRKTTTNPCKPAKEGQLQRLEIQKEVKGIDFDLVTDYRVGQNKTVKK